MNKDVYQSALNDNKLLREELARIEKQLDDALAKVKRLEKKQTLRRDEVLIATGLKKRLSNLLKRQV